MATLGTFTSGSVLSAAELNAIAAITSFTPTWTNLTVVTGTNTGRYALVNELVFMQVDVEFGSTTSITGQVVLDLPVEAASFRLDGSGGQVWLEDATSTDYFGAIIRNNTTSVIVRVWNSSGTYVSSNDLSSTVPFTWTTNDKLTITHWYRQA
jgi:hypothetical protein